MTILLDDRTFKALAECAELTELSKGALVRNSITNYHAMVVHSQPTCANGQQCFCPTMHQRIALPAAIVATAPPTQPPPNRLPDLDTSIVPEAPTIEAAQ